MKTGEISIYFKTDATFQTRLKKLLELNLFKNYFTVIYEYILYLFGARMLLNPY
jgi:hypothetical protein